MAMRHYECEFGKLGEFDYDDEEFHVNRYYEDSEYLEYIGKEKDGRKITIPDGVRDCSFMFEGCSFLEIPPVIPDGVKNCSHMFSGCKLLKMAPVVPKSVEFYVDMFDGCSDKVQESGIWNCAHRGMNYASLPKRPKEFVREDVVEGIVNQYDIQKGLGE